jgi:ABC-type Na+ efflux pump permease subunit
MLSARPVVPLETINAKIKNRRYWLLAGALVVAMMLGAGSAILASYLRFRNVAAPAAEMSQQEITPAPQAVAESAPSASPEESVAGPSPMISEEPAKAVRPVKQKTIVKTTPDVVEEASRNESKVDEEDQLQRIREAVLYDQWQERRARRVARERRRLDRYNHRDLSDLDEIFEGRKKP